MADGVKNESKIKSFFSSVRKEFKRIVWPSKDRLTKETVAVVIVSVILGLIIAGLDFLFYTGLGMIIK